MSRVSATHTTLYWINLWLRINMYLHRQRISGITGLWNHICQCREAFESMDHPGRNLCWLRAAHLSVSLCWCPLTLTFYNYCSRSQFLCYCLGNGIDIPYESLLEQLLLSHFSLVRLCATPDTAAHQAPPSMGFSRQEYWSGVPLPSLYWCINGSFPLWYT